MRVHVHILPSVICDERMKVVLHDLLRHDKKYGNLMHNCMFTCIVILLIYHDATTVVFPSGYSKIAQRS